jgi:sodium/hydrogen exchanger 8
MLIVTVSGSFTWDWSFIFVNIAACMIGRFVNTFPLCMMSNCRRKKSIPWSYMVIIWFAGLRGAIAFALALNVTTPDSKHSGVIKSSTLFTVIFTTLVCRLYFIALLCNSNGTLHYMDIGLWYGYRSSSSVL